MSNIEKIIHQYTFSLWDIADHHQIKIDLFQPKVPGKIFGFKITIKGTYDCNVLFQNEIGPVGVHHQPLGFNWVLVKYNGIDNLLLNDPWHISGNPDKSFIGYPKYVILGGQWLGTLKNGHNQTLLIPPTTVPFTKEEEPLSIEAILVGTVTDFTSVPLVTNIGATQGEINVPQTVIQKINIPTTYNDIPQLASQGCIYKKIYVEEKSRTGRLIALNEILSIELNFNRNNHAHVCIFVQFFFEKQ